MSEVVDFGVPLVPAGSTAGGFTDRATADIAAGRGDRLSVAAMLICTNDGLTGVDITLDERDLDGGPFEGDFPGFVAALRSGELYVNVHTSAYPGGEIRGQIGASNGPRHHGRGLDDPSFDFDD